MVLIGVRNVIRGPRHSGSKCLSTLLNAREAYWPIHNEYSLPNDGLYLAGPRPSTRGTRRSVVREGLAIGASEVYYTRPAHRSFEAGMRRSGQLHHIELRCELLGTENEEGVRPQTRNEPRDLHSGVRSGATV